MQILTNVNGQELSDPAFAPFWKKAEELQALVVLHPLGFTEGKRLSRFSFNNTIGNPLDTTIALHYLIFDGVLERHPNLKILAVHGGGYLAAYSGRIDHAWGARSDAHGDLPHPPTSYLQEIYFDSVVFTPHQLAELVRLYGADRIIMGTDYPFDMADYDPIGHVASAGLRRRRPSPPSPAAMRRGCWGCNSERAAQSKHASSFSRGISSPRFALFPSSREGSGAPTGAWVQRHPFVSGPVRRPARPRAGRLSPSARRGTLASRRSTAAIYWPRARLGDAFGRCRRGGVLRPHQTAFAGPARSSGRTVSLGRLPGVCLHEETRGTPHPALLKQCLAKAPSADGTPRR